MEWLILVLLAGMLAFAFLLRRCARLAREAHTQVAALSALLSDLQAAHLTASEHVESDRAEVRRLSHKVDSLPGREPYATLVRKVEALERRPLPAPIADESAAVADLRAEMQALKSQLVDYRIEQPISQEPHSHIWGNHPIAADTTSQTFRCQMPYCSRVHTQLR